MNTYKEVLNIHKEIQQNIYKMLPEKFKRLYLYASMVDAQKDTNGEMFMYYFPTGILKKNPVNIYMVPELFDIDEEQYKKMEDRLYNTIKKLRSNYKSNSGTRWTSVTISIEETKYKAEFDYDDIINSEFNNFERHIIWRYKYLGLPLESYSKDEKKIIQNYLNSKNNKKNLPTIYEANIYEKPTITVMQYHNIEFKQVEEEKNMQLQNIKQKKNNKNMPIQKAKNQLLNF
jgi:hypothetical protein